MLRLPTEAEWEYAAKGEPGSVYAWGNAEPNDNLANFSLSTTTPVGLYLQGQTPEGLLDLTGNVDEWCWDHWDERAYQNREGETVNPFVTGMKTAVRPLRGGSWDCSARFLPASLRLGFGAGFRSRLIGFRPVVSVSAEHVP